MAVPKRKKSKAWKKHKINILYKFLISNFKYHNKFKYNNNINDFFLI